MLSRGQFYLRHGYADHGTPIHLHGGLLAGGDHLAPGQPRYWYLPRRIAAGGKPGSADAQ
jgi:hypothetical protein